MRKTFSPSNEAKQRKIQASDGLTSDSGKTAKRFSDDLLDFIATMPDSVREYLGEDDIATLGEAVDILQDIYQMF